MNVFKTVEERQLCVEELLKEEKKRLLDGHNPFSIVAPLIDKKKEENISLETALDLAYSKITVAPITKRDIKLSVDQIKKALQKLELEGLNILETSRKYIKLLLEEASGTSDRYNKNRSHLMILFSELCEMEMVEYNPVKDIRKKNVIKRIRQIPSDSERKIVNEFLLKKYPGFHRFLHIFYHSGTRISELLRVREFDVDIDEQRFKMVIQKGRGYREVWRIIKDISLPYWQELMKECRAGDYLFSKGLKPGQISIQPYQVGKRWYRLNGRDADMWDATTSTINAFLAAGTNPFMDWKPASRRESGLPHLTHDSPGRIGVNALAGFLTLGMNMSVQTMNPNANQTATDAVLGTIEVATQEATKKLPIDNKRGF
jgi:site-specific recombinase XerC